MRNDQLVRLQRYVRDAIQPSGLVRDSLVLSPNDSHFHPATPDAAGFALVALSAFDQLGSWPDAQQTVIDVLTAHAGLRSGVQPDRSADGHFVHFMNVDTGIKQGGGWDESYSPISSALLVAGAQFAARHFHNDPTIVALADTLTQSVDFNAAIHPSLDGRIFLDMTQQGGGAGNTVRPWNEFMLVESLALRQANNDRAIAVKHRWLNPARVPQADYAGHRTLGDGGFAPAFWVQQMQFLNGDFRHSDDFQTFFLSQQAADKAYAQNVLSESFRYGLTAGAIPNGYHADRIFDHPSTVFSPEAVAAWGDMATLLDFYIQQPPASDPRYRYGMVRVSAEQPPWIPTDAGLVDHLFLLFGLMESIDADFFAQRIADPLVPGDYNGNGLVDAADYTVWRDSLGTTSRLHADGDLNGRVQTSDYTVWQQNFTGTDAAEIVVPEPSTWPLAAIALVFLGRLKLSSNIANQQFELK